MGELEQFERKDASHSEAYGSDAGRNGHGRRDLSHLDPRTDELGTEPVSRPSGAPLPVGSSLKQGHSLAGPGDVRSTRPSVPPPGRALGTAPQAEEDHSPAMQWAVSAMKQAVPFLQRLLPLIDGNIATAFGNVLATRPHAPAPSPRVDLQPIEAGLTELQGQQRELRNQVVEHNASLKRVEDHLEMVREATDRNTLEQQELIEDLKAIGNKVNLFAALLLVLLVISVLLNLFLFLHIQRVLP